jgi:hypothetical protein
MNWIQKAFLVIYTALAIIGTITLWEIAKWIYPHIHLSRIWG